MTQENRDKIAYTVLATISPFFLLAMIIALIVAFKTPAKGTILSEQKVEYKANFEKEIEPLIAKDSFSREMLKKDPERLVEYMHITDVLYGTNLCNGVDEDRLTMQLKADPLLTASFSERYFEYLDGKYN